MEARLIPVRPVNLVPHRPSAPRFSAAAVCALALAATACLRPPSEAELAKQEAAKASAAASGSNEGKGPQAVPYEWKSVAIVGGGFVTGLIYSPVKAGILYARTDIGGAYRYDPVKKSWIPLTDFLSKADGHYMGIESIAADPVNADRVYMAVGMYTQSWAGTGAFMRSDDRGDNWRVIPMPYMKMGGNEMGRGNGERLAVDPLEPKTLYFGSRKNGLWKSTDEALTWSRVDSFPAKDDANGFGIPIVIPVPNGQKPGQPSKLIYAGVSDKEVGMYRSQDAGKTWQPLPKQPKGNLPSRAVVDKDGKLYIAYSNGPGPHDVTDGALYRFDPKSDTWTDISPIKPSDGDKFGYAAVALDAQRPGTLVATTIDRWAKGGEIFRTSDGGKTWKPMMTKATIDGDGVAHTYHHRPKIGAPQWMSDIKIDPFDSKIAMTVDGGGIWATHDLTEADADKPTAWAFHTRNLEETAVRALVSPPEGPQLLSVMADVCGFRHDSLDESPKRGTFTNPTCASADSIDFAGKKPSVVARAGSHPWDGTKGPRGAVSFDAGSTWKQFEVEPPGSEGLGNIVVSADGSTLLWAARGARAAYTTDNGKTWKDAAGLPNPTKTPEWAPHALRLASDRVNAKKLYAYDALTGDAYVSVDGGANFTKGSTPLSSRPEYELVTTSIQAVPGKEGEAWITAGKQLARTTDSGQSYLGVGTVDEAFALGFGKAAPGKSYPSIYISGKVEGLVGFFRSDDEGESWVRINDDKHQYGGSFVIIGDPRVYGRVYIGPPGRGIIYGEPKN